MKGFNHFNRITRQYRCKHLHFSRDFKHTEFDSYMIPSEEIKKNIASAVLLIRVI